MNIFKKMCLDGVVRRLKGVQEPPLLVQKLDIVAIQNALQGTGWKFNTPFFIPSPLSPLADTLADAQAENTQLKFLLASAPMIDAPSRINVGFFQSASAPFGYIHPKTLAQYSLMRGVGHPVFKQPGSPTQRIVTSLMPEGRVLFSPFPMPGIEKLLAK